MNCEWPDKIFSTDREDFSKLALEIFRYQFDNNPLYATFAATLHIDPHNVKDVASIPFLPVSFFKSHNIVTGSFDPEIIFESSGTTMTGNSRHLVKNADLYRKSFMKGFDLFYGPLREWCIIGLLPSYLERQNSSLIMMVNELIIGSGHQRSGFCLYDYEMLADIITINEAQQQKTLLIGVTFALLDFAAAFKKPLKHTVVMETGGMKGRRKEITRDEVHAIFSSTWELPTIHSEYGMTELLSQAYSEKEGIFRCPPWMKVVMREEDDPLSIKLSGDPLSVNGLVNVIDLANIYSCAFIATDDIGRLHPDGSFEIMGRMDSSEVRGCSLLYDGQVR